MKKRKGVSIPKALRQQPAAYSSTTIIRRAREYPVVGSWISSDWQQKESSGLVIIIVARQQPDDNICLGVYLVDKFCLGLKNTFARTKLSPAHYQQEVQELFQDMRPRACSPELAYQMIYESIDYAAQFGFSPQQDFERTQYLLAPRGEFNASHKLEFGKNGKPFFIAGPHDNVTAILRQLEQTAGQGNYDYIAMAPPDMF